jgi:hypothetical protein
MTSCITIRGVEENMYHLLIIKDIKVLTIFSVLVTDVLVIAANLITQPASAFITGPFGLPFGPPSGPPFPYNYCTHYYFGQQNFRNTPFGLPFGPLFPYNYCTHYYFGQHKFRNDPFELPFP